jgi:hypothetical protein
VNIQHMDIQHSMRERRRRFSLRDTLAAQRAYPTKVLHGAARRLSAHAHPVAPTQEQKRLVLTGLVLGGLSIITLFFPICALPAAITGLLLGFYGRSTTPLRTMSLWTICLSSIGLICACISIFTLVSTYASKYLMQ